MPRQTTRPPRPELVQALRRHGTAEATADVLGVHRTTLHRWLRELGIRLEWVAEGEAVEEGAESA